MEDNRKVAVAFGSFACVVEGYDQPFRIIRNVARYFEDLSNENPNFADWASLADMDDLKGRLDQFAEGAAVEMETLPGGVRIRRLTGSDQGQGQRDVTPAQDAAEDRILDPAAAAALGVAAADSTVEEPALAEESG